MQRCFLIFLLFLLASQSVWAQDINPVDLRMKAIIHTIEVGADSPIPGVTLRIGKKVIGITDANGYAAIDPGLLPATITFSGVGFEAFSSKVDAGARQIDFAIPRRLNDLKETVVTGVPRPTPLKNALSQYRIINMEEGMAQGNITLADALSTQLNIGVSNDGVLGSNARMQGMNGSKIKILIDGLPVNGRENGNIDMGQLNLNNIARVEVIQGPMSVVYGSDALGGVINLITKKQAAPLLFNGQFNYESVGRYNADAAITRSWKHHAIMLGGGRNFFRGWGDADTFSSVAHRRLIFKPKEQYLANGAYTYASDSGFRLQLSSDFIREKVTDRGAASVNPFSGYGIDNYYRVTRSNNRLILEGKLGRRGHWESRNNLAWYHRVRQQVRKDLVSLDEIPTTGSGDQDTSTFNDVNLRSNYSNTFGKLKYDAGYDVNIGYAKSGKIPGGTKNVEDYALYQNFSHSFFKDKLTAQAGLRETYNTQYNAPFVYSFQTLYQPIEKLQLRASYGKGFRAPTLKEQYLEFVDQNHHIYGSPNLKAEYSNSLQVSASWQLYQRKNDYVQLIVTGFFNDVKDQILLAPENPNDPQSPYYYVNLARTKNAIANIQLEQQWNNLHLVLEYGYTHTWPQLIDSIYRTSNVQEFIARANYYWQDPRLSFSAFYKLTGSAPSIVAGIDGNATYKGKLPAYSMMDASVSRKFFKKRIEIIAGIKNIFDVRSISPAGAPVSSGSAHATDDGSGSFLPRRLFTTVRLNLF